MVRSPVRHGRDLPLVLWGLPASWGRSIEHWSFRPASDLRYFDDLLHRLATDVESLPTETASYPARALRRTKRAFRTPYCGTVRYGLLRPVLAPT